MRADFAPLRHNIVRVDATHWRTALAAPLTKQHAGLVDAWFALGHPAVVRRSGEEETRAAWTVALGIPLPLSNGKLRIPLLLAADAIVTIEPPPILESAISSAPVAWHGALRELDTAGKNEGIAFSVYGSLAWQYLTGERYVTEGSDIDLLWKPLNQRQAERGLALLSRWERNSGLRADGELRLPDDSCVSWRELLTAQRTVLVKHERWVALRPKHEVLASWSEVRAA